MNEVTENVLSTLASVITARVPAGEQDVSAWLHPTVLREVREDLPIDPYGITYALVDEVTVGFGTDCMYVGDEDPDAGCGDCLQCTDEPDGMTVAWNDPPGEQQAEEVWLIPPGFSQQEADTYVTLREEGKLSAADAARMTTAVLS